MSTDTDTIRQMIQHENELVNHRLTWMTAGQGLLFTALAFIWNKHPLLILVISIVGFLSCISYGYVMYFSDKAITSLIRKIEENTGQKIDEIYPPVIGYAGKSWVWLLPWRFIPWLFGFAWLSVVLIKLC